MKLKLDVFLSSDQQEFYKTRIKLAKMICGIQFLECVPLESRGATDEDAKSASLKAARNCDIFIGIFGDQYSEITIEEYYEAVKHRKRCLFYVKRSRQRSDELSEFIDKELKTRFKYHEFKKRKDLCKQVKRDLNQLLFDTLNRGLKTIKKEKARAQSIEKSAARMGVKFMAKPAVKDRFRIMFDRSQRAYKQGMYTESIVTSAIAIEFSLKDALLKAGLKKEELRSTGWLFNFALKYGLIDKRELTSLRELQQIRNMTIHEGMIPSKEMAAWVLQITKRILDSG